MSSFSAYGYRFEEPRTPLSRTEFKTGPPEADEVVVEVAGCGLCHTDISFWSGAVRPNQMPVILGHEISGTVIASGSSYADLQGKSVVIPAVLPCGDCELCRSGRGNVCRAQRFPGNDFDGGFASHVTVPGRFLCVLPDNLSGIELWELSVVADAVTTPYQALVRSGTRQGDLAIVVGVGGIGTYMVQHARRAGADVIAIDVDAAKLAAAERMGARWTIDAAGKSEGDVKKMVRGLAKEHNLPGYGWRVFETSGTAGGQRTAFALLSFAGTLGVVGFTMDTVDVRLSNVMAFDAEIFGNWACVPEHYPAVVSHILGGEINVRDNVEAHPLDSINEVMALANQHKIEKRVVFIP